MKRLYASLFFALTFSLLHAQFVDTVFFENFQGIDDPVPNWPLFPSGDDLTWVNNDADGLEPFTFDDVDRQWFSSEFFYDATDSVTGETNYVVASLSYMANFAVGNRNWLIMPPIQVIDDSYTLHWSSAPFQLPRYMDGYSVWASVDGNDLYGFSNPFTDLVFRAASMDAVVGEGESIDISNFTFTPGYFHADSLQDTTYVEPWTPGDTTLMHAYLEPHSVSLAAYAGETLYIAFLHDSDDDYYLALDDFLVTRNVASGAQDQAALDLRFRTYPNPVVDKLNVLYRLSAPARASLRLSDMGGRLLWEANSAGTQPAGEQSFNVPTARLAPGAYTITLTVGDAAVSRVFVKK